MASLLVKPSEGNAYRIGLDAGEVTVGRSSSNRISLDTDPKVSREHCRIERSGDKFVVQDLGTSNGTSVGGAKIGAAPRELWHGDVIGVGSARIVYEDPSRRRESMASRIIGSISGLFSAKPAEPPSDEVLRTKGRMRCSRCGTMLNISGKAPGEKVGCPRCRTIHRAPG